MNDYTIRRAVIDDIKKIQELSQELMEYEKQNATKEFMFNMDWALSEAGYNNYKYNIENDWLYVACVNDEIVGYMTCWINKKRPWLEYQDMEIGNLYIQEKYRRLGIGSEFINIAKNLCKENSVKFLKILVLDDDKDAKAFYNKHGLYNYEIEQYAKIL